MLITASQLTAGNGGGATLAGTALPITQWSVNNTGTVQTFINSLSGLHPLRIVTFQDLIASITVDWAPSLQPFQTSVMIVVGTTLTNVFLQISSTVGWTISSAVVTAMGNSTEIAGKVGTTISIAVSGGTVMPPGGNPV